LVFARALACVGLAVDLDTRLAVAAGALAAVFFPAVVFATDAFATGIDSEFKAAGLQSQ
jgi:hypothetical protein